MFGHTRSMLGHPAKRHPRKHSVSSHLRAERSTNEQALHKLQQEIAKYESELRDHEKREQRSKKNIKIFAQRTASLKATIARLKEQAHELQSSKTEVDRTFNVTSNTLDTLKGAYARSSRQLYMQNTLLPLDANDMMISSPASDPIRMSYYAEVIARAHAMSRTRLDSMKQSLAESSHELASTIESEQEQIGEHQSEASTLEEKKAAEAKQLGQIQARKAYLLKLLANRKASEKRLEGIIANLVARENSAHHAARRRGAVGHGRSASKELAAEESLGPARGPHSLQWPSAGHHILEGFGEHRNAELNTVTMNLGIDISAAQGSPVRAAAEGEVALVSSLPSYGTIVVLRHSGGLHTVYANLSSASVHPGQYVHAGATVGRSGINDESTALIHFEVWSGKTRQNPLGWLK
jgi:murein hydrolase activator